MIHKAPEANLITVVVQNGGSAQFPASILNRKEA